jgi:hypothetical protein
MGVSVQGRKPPIFCELYQSRIYTSRLVADIFSSLAIVDYMSGPATVSTYYS